jgi:hypothetical protein
MSQQQSPWLETAYGWTYGENGWNTGMDSNLLKFSVMFDRNVDSIVASLPAAVNGQVHYNTSDNRLYFAVNTTYFSTPVPKWFVIVERSTGQTHQYNGVSLVQIDSTAQLDTRLGSVELTVASLGTAAFEDVEFFATQAGLDVAEADAAAYTDTLRQDLADDTDAAKGAGIPAYNPALTYTAGSVGAALNAIAKASAVSVLDEGADPTGATDSSAAFAAARAKAAITGKFVYAPAGSYTLDVAIAGSTDLRIIGDGDSTVLDFTGTVTGGNYALEATGAATQIEELSGTQSVGLNTVVFVSPPSLVPGDVFVIYNPADSSWSGFRPVYRAGEWCQVESVSGNTVTTVTPLYDSYAAANVDVYKITGPEVVLRDFKIVGTTVAGLIRTTFCLSPLLENITGEHASDSVAYFDRNWCPVFNNPKIRNVGDGGDDYGIAISNSQHARVNGGSVYSRRHAVTHGGSDAICSVPVRDSRVHSVLLRNDAASGTEAADFHGNTEDSSFIDCTIYGGGNLQGKDNFYVNCTINHTLTGYAVYHAEVKGGRLGLKGCELRTHINPFPAGRGVIDIGGNSPAITANTVLPFTFVMDNCSVYGRNLSATTSLVRLANSGCTQDLNIEIDGITADVNALSSILTTSLVSGVAASSRIVVDNIKGFAAGVLLHNPIGAAYRDFPHRLQKQTGQLTLTAATGTAVTVAAIQTFKHPYPRTPAGLATSVGGINGNRHAIAELNALTSTTIRPQILTGDQVDWSATSDRVVSWTAFIDEV